MNVAIRGATSLTLSEVPQGEADKAPTSDARFWSKVDRSAGPDACWQWTAYRTELGYGRFAAGWTSYAHREAARLAFGDFDPSLEVCHTCDNPSCCNPTHLFLGTHKENFQDASRKGRLGNNAGERHGNAKLNWAKVDAIRARFAAGESQQSLAAAFGVTQPNIWLIVNGKAWTKRPDLEREAVA